MFTTNSNDMTHLNQQDQQNYYIREDSENGGGIFTKAAETHNISVRDSRQDSDHTKVQGNACEHHIKHGDKPCWVPLKDNVPTWQHNQVSATGDAQLNSNDEQLLEDYV